MFSLLATEPSEQLTPACNNLFNVFRGQNMHKYHNGDVGGIKQIKRIHQKYFSKLSDAPLAFSSSTVFNDHIRTQIEEEESIMFLETEDKQANVIRSNIH